MPSDGLINRRFVYNGHASTVADYDGHKRLAIVMDDQPHQCFSVSIDLPDDPSAGLQLDLYLADGQFYAWPASGRGEPPALRRGSVVEPSADA
ncbi:hypothetical protein Cs7R123_57410 [Catellatospora sp. TT07R-123]|uniref:hypothetical protein n=1 Tax=Catellatospora sp. TT07R-123 TaxID=2733863 RepID=UPI001B196009|nr:hypothetical protein [Catellatospora sp. TT07R-123]GHJ48399.1 hypothetical protein Cs7R123_57410 [Catellatospora sp. TT07R-123]